MWLLNAKVLRCQRDLQQHNGRASGNAMVGSLERKEAANASNAVHCPRHHNRGRPRCWGQGGRAQARLAQKRFRRRQDSGPQRHEEFSERTAATVMSAFDPKRTSGLNISRSPLRRKVVGFKPCTECVFGGP